MKILWVDLICFKTIFLIIYKSCANDFDSIKYVNSTRVSRSIAPILGKILRKPISQISNVDETEYYVDGVNLYEVIQIRINDLLDKWISSSYVENKINIFSAKYQYNQKKYAEHLKESGYYLAFRPVELYSLSEVLNPEGVNTFIFKKNALSRQVKSFFDLGETVFYSRLGGKVEDRVDYFFDRYTNSRYYHSNLRPCLSLMHRWVVASSLGLFFTERVKYHNKSVGVELLQQKVQLDYINDIYWLRDSSIRNIFAFSYVDYDHNSMQILKDCNVTVLITSDDISKSPFKFLIKYKSTVGQQIITVGKRYFLSTTRSFLKTILSMFLNNEFGWLNFQECYYDIRSKYWLSMYRKLNLNVLWTMYDIDPDKLTKSQAIDLCDGLYLGSHWSNYPIWQPDIEKCYDIFFVWSRHFSSTNLYTHYNYKAIFQTGYPLDYYFSPLRSSLLTKKKKYQGKFVLSYFDNMLANDLPFSHGMQKGLYEMFIELLQDFDNLIVLLKPKRISEFYRNLDRFPYIKEFIDSGRMEVFLGESERVKIRPAEMAFYSDLTIGLGVSTAASESCFFGTVSFHANLSRVVNAFDQRYLDKVVFRDIPSLKKAIIRQITDQGITADECKEYHKKLDVFQDGLAYKRVGDIVGYLHESIGLGYSKVQAIEGARKKFPSESLPG